MKLFDFLIIYLACGAPVAVYFFLQNRRRLYFKQLWLKTILNFLFWVPFVLQIIRKSDYLQKIFRRASGADSARAEDFSAAAEEKIARAQKNIENIIYDSKIAFSVYDFREVCERFVGLSIAALNDAPQPAAFEKEIFRIAFRQSTELSARCYHRRNRNRLFFHQNQAEHDFLQIVSAVADSVPDRTELLTSALEIVSVLGNEKLRLSLDRMMLEQTQIRRVLPVSQLEKGLWNSVRRLPPNAQPVSMESPIINLRTKSSVKD